MITFIDLNADVGEYADLHCPGQDPALLTVISSANIACGVHAGTIDVMRATVTAAARHGVSVGAHPSLSDAGGFGRREVPTSPHEVAAMVRQQVSMLWEIARAAAVRLRHVKPHGALYNMAARDAVLAAAVCSAVCTVDESLAMFCPPGSALATASGSAGLRVVREGFADRAYAGDGSLVPRSQPGAVLHDEARVVERALRLVHDHSVLAIDGTVVPLDVDTICVHGDTPGAALLAARIRAALTDAGVGIRAPSAEA